MPSFIYIEAALLQMQLETRSIEEGENFINSPEAKEKRKLIDTLYKFVRLFLYEKVFLVCFTW